MFLGEILNTALNRILGHNFCCIHILCQYSTSPSGSTAPMHHSCVFLLLLTVLGKTFLPVWDYGVLPLFFPRSMLFPITRISCHSLWQSDNIEKFMVAPPQFNRTIIPCMLRQIYKRGYLGYGRFVLLVTFHGSGTRTSCAFRENMIQE